MKHTPNSGAGAKKSKGLLRDLACARLFAPAALFNELPSRAVNRFCGLAVSSNANVQTKMLP